MPILSRVKVGRDRPQLCTLESSLLFVGLTGKFSWSRSLMRRGEAKFVIDEQHAVGGQVKDKIGDQVELPVRITVPIEDRMRQHEAISTKIGAVVASVMTAGVGLGSASRCPGGSRKTLPTGRPAFRVPARFCPRQTAG